MARPKKSRMSEEDKIAMEEKIQEAEQEFKKEDEVKNEKKTLKSTLDERAEARRLESKRLREIRQKISRDIEIVVMSNCSSGTYLYIDPKHGTRYEFSKYGQIAYMPYDEFEVLVRQKRSHLEKYRMIPIDVVSDEITIDDIIDVQGLRDLYKEEMLYDDNLDYILFIAKDNEFDFMLENMNPRYLDILIERAVYLYKEKQFKNINRLKELVAKVGNDDLFYDIIE